MTAKELIKILEQHPEDIEILLEYDGWFLRARTVEKQVVVLNGRSSEEKVEGLVIE